MGRSFPAQSKINPFIYERIEDMPMGSSTSLWIKASAQVVYRDFDSLSSFLTTVNNIGATVEMTAANVWTTVVDITGHSGFVGNIFSPSVAAVTPGTTEMRLTIDGGAPIVITAVLANAVRLFMGAAALGRPGSNPWDESSMLRNNAQTGIYNSTYARASYGKIVDAVRDIGDGSYWTINDVSTMMTVGMPVLRFNTGFKCEFRVAAVEGATYDYLTHAGLTYILAT